MWRWLGLFVVLASAAAVWSTWSIEDEPFPVVGTFILWDEFQADPGELCDAKRSFYHDINRDTPVTLSAVGERQLEATSLGNGRIATAAEMAAILRAGGTDVAQTEVEALLRRVALEPCVFEFGFTVRPGSDGGRGYVVALGRRGEWTLTEDEIREPGRLQLSVGLRSPG